MKNNFIGEVIFTILLVALLIFFLNPVTIMMPQSLHMIVLPLLIVFFIALAGIFWREVLGDEREQYHRLIVSRFAYFAGIFVLLIAVLYQSLRGKVDAWLIITMCTMLLAKILGSFYTKLKK